MIGKPSRLLFSRFFREIDDVHSKFHLAARARGVEAHWRDDLELEQVEMDRGQRSMKDQQ